MHVLGKRICLCATVDKCRDLHHSFPGHQHLAPGSYRCHRPTVIPRTVPLLSQHPRCMEHCWAVSRYAGLRGPWRAHQTKLAAKVSQLKCLVVLFGPAAVFVGVFSFGRILLQVMIPSFTGAQSRRVSNPSAHAAFEAFSFAFDLSSTFAFPLPLPFAFGF